VEIEEEGQSKTMDKQWLKQQKNIVKPNPCLQNGHRAKARFLKPEIIDERSRHSF